MDRKDTESPYIKHPSDDVQGNSFRHGEDPSDDTQKADDTDDVQGHDAKSRVVNYPTDGTQQADDPDDTDGHLARAKF